MRPKTKLKSDSNSPRTSLDNNSNHEAQSNQRMAQKSGAFSYIKSRLFHTASPNGQKPCLDLETTSNEPLITPAPENTYMSSTATAPAKRLDIPTGNARYNQPESATNLSKSFDPPTMQAWDNARGTGNARPVSVLGLEGVMQQVTTPNSRRSELTDAHARQLSSMTTPIKRINSPSIKQSQGKTKRFSGIVIKEGYLFKKTDFKSFSRSARLDRSWKGYQVVLRGHKLYLYRTPHEHALKAYFPSPKDNIPVSNSNASFSSRSPSSEVFPYSFPFQDKGMSLDLTDFDPESYTVISSICGNVTDISNMSSCVEYLYGDCFTETDSKTGEYQGYHFLMIFTKRLIICKRDWSNIKSAPTSDSVGAHGDTAQSAYKWRLDLDLPLDAVSLVEPNESDKNASTEEMRLKSDAQPDVGEQFKGPKSQSISVAVQGFELDILPPDENNRRKRLFVPSSSGSGKIWIEQFQSATRNYTSQPNIEPLPVIAVLEAPHDDINDELVLKELKDFEDVFDYRDIKGGSVRELARELVRKRENYSENSYQEFLRALLLTYTIFTTSTEITSILKNQLLATDGDEELSQWTKQRVYNILKVWSDEFRVNVVGEVATELLDIVDMDIWQSSTAPETANESIQYLREHIIAVINDNAVKYETTVAFDMENPWYDSAVNTVIKSSTGDNDQNDTMDVSDFIATGFTVDVFLQMDPAEFAKQLYLFHQMAFQVYKSRFLNPLCYIPQTLPATMTPSHLLFTTSSPHFLTNFVNQHILMDSIQIGSDKVQQYMFRAKLIEHWIKVGDQLLILGDMCGWCCIAVSVCSFAVLRLKQSWQFVSPELIERVTFIWAPILHYSNMFSIDVWMDFWKKYPHDRLNVLDPELTGVAFPEGYQARTEKVTGGMPFFGIIRQFVERVRKHMERHLHLSNTQHELDVRIVNFEKYWSIYYAVYRTLKRYQENYEHEATRKHPHIEPVGPIQAFFEHNHVNLSSIPHDFNVLQDCSLQCEPKQVMPGLEARAHQKWKVFGEGITPPPNWLLTFPQLFSIITLKDTVPGIFYPNVVRNMKMFQQTASSKPGRSKKIAMPDTIRESDDIEKVDEITAESRKSTIQETDGQVRNRKRTYSFPSSRSNSDFGLDSTLSATANMESNSRSWINPEAYKSSPASLKSPFHAISHIGAVGEKLLSVRDGELILQLETADDKLPDANSKPSMKAIHQPLIKPVDASKTGMSFTWTEDALQTASDESNIQPRKVLVKAGTVSRLLDVLIYGVSEYSANLDSQDEFGEYVFSECRLWVDMENYINVFFSMYRVFVSSTEVLEHFRKTFRNASSIGRIAKLRQKYSLKSMFEPSFDTDKSIEELDYSDWKYVARVRLQILDLFCFWIDNYFWDFKDDNSNRKRISHFLEQTSASTDEMRIQVLELMEEQGDTGGEAENIFDAINMLQTKITAIQRLFLMHLITPPVKLKYSVEPHPSTIDQGKIVALYKGRYVGAREEAKPVLSLATANPPSPSKSNRHSQSVLDQLSASEIFQQTDALVRRNFAAITIQDWLVLWDVLFAQSLDPNAWLPPRKGAVSPGANITIYPPYTEQVGGSHPIDEEIIISDIFIAIQSARQFAVPSTHLITENLLKAFPNAVQQLITLHFSIRSWIISELTSCTIDADQRAERIQKCLDMISISRVKLASEPTIQDFIIDSEKVDENTGHGKVIPGFVEYSILSALVSPPVRLFVKSWSKVSEKNGYASLDTLESIVDASILKFKKFKSATKLSTSRPCVIGLSWIIRIMLQACDDNIPHMRTSSPHVRVEQVRYCYNFVRFISSMQDLVLQDNTIRTSESADFTEKLGESLAPRMMDFLVSPQTTYPAIAWKEMREFANRENASFLKHMSSHPSRLGSTVTHSSHTGTNAPKSIVFSKLIARQQEKSKSDMKDRERIDKEWRENQQKLHKKQQEQAKSMEKREKKLLKHQHSASRHHHQSPSHLPWINSFLRGLKLTHTNTENQDSLTNVEGFPTPFPTENMKASNVINLINSTSSVASTYVKRDSVFRIVTEEGGQYLFQAMNDSDMHDWIRSINGAAKEGAARRLTVLVAEAESKLRSGAAEAMNFLDDRHIKKGKDARGSVYGADISELMPSGHIPLVVEKCIEEIERRGLEEVGIYRVAGSGETVSELRQQLNRYATTVNLGDDQWIDINVVADALKQFFRELPEPLLTYERYGDYMKASALQDHDERVLAIKRVTKQLPPNNYNLLKRVIEHFVVVTDYESSNHMYATNLAIVFGPTLLRPAPGPVSFATTMANIGHQQNIVKNLITHYHFVFDVENEELEREPVVAEDDDTITQTVSNESE
ncbi:hypothetical protein INT43_000571 [Umbelopsis isabellina]|uniref:Uncharacterized protein n=1 Tax=Mortierella isabellina TaxID=91625 RepID=A0A8H7ULZ1_MORIS|nr:hypothetical protein INT43_000571 [Umbelopsis isabellina]